VTGYYKSDAFRCKENIKAVRSRSYTLRNPESFVLVTTRIRMPYIDTRVNRWKKLSIAVVGVRNQLRRVSTVAIARGLPALCGIWIACRTSALLVTFESNCISVGSLKKKLRRLSAVGSNELLANLKQRVTRLGDPQSFVPRLCQTTVSRMNFQHFGTRFRD
jgi:hypothetical protein